jgi:16S rRNA (cytosine1402-N4)-methyltransferase
MSQPGSEYHHPVMLQECMDGLRINPEGIYVDVTFGGGGHSKAILERLTTGKLFAFDQDADALPNAAKITNRSFTLIEANFRYLNKFLKLHGVTRIDGLLADLGVSSHQINEAERGFSTRFDAALDMRMDRAGSKTAETILNSYSEKELHRIFGMYGEVRNAKTLAAAVMTERTRNPITTIDQLKQILSRFAKRGRENKYYAQVFQALRIEVNEELVSLEEMLGQTPAILNPGGRLVIMSYHSLEDRIVKNFLNTGNVKGDLEKDFYGNILRPLEPLTRKPITASREETEKNNRARSAKLRIGERKE